MSAWSELLDLEETARRAAIEAGGDPTIERKAYRMWWRCVEKIFSGAAVDPNHIIPRKLLRMLAAQAGYLAVGKLPLPITSVAGRGIKSPGPTEVQQIRDAVTYRRAVEAGVIDDHRPVQTIMAAYAVKDATTIQGWCREYRPFDMGAPRIIIRRMQASGASYQVANGRSWKSRETPRRK